MINTLLHYIEKKSTCPHCATELSLCHAPAMHVGDGLGWGCEYLLVCLNDECSLFVNGWEYIENQYGHSGSYRYMEIPGGKESYNMMVGSKDAFTGSLVDIEDIKRQSKRYQRLQQALVELETCLEQKKLDPVLTVLLDDSAHVEERKRALELLVPLNDVSCVETLRNHAFKNPHLEQEVNLAIEALLAQNFLKECPFCAELIKSRATVCKHCQKDLPVLPATGA